MSNTVVQTWPVVNTRVVEVEVPGIQGPQGPKGDLTAEAKKVRDEITKIKADVETSEANASASAEKAQEYAEDSEQAHQDTVTEKNNALSAIQTEGQNQIDLIEAEGEEQIEAVESAGNTAVTGVQIEAGKQIERIQKEGGLQVDRVGAAGDAVVAEVEDTKDAAVEAVEQEGTTQTGLVTAEGEKQVSAVTTEGNTQITNVKNEGSTQVTNVKNESQTQITLIKQEGTDQVQTVTEAGTAQIGLVEAEGAEQVSLVQVAGDEQIAKAQEYAQAAEDARDEAVAARDQAQEIASDMGDPLGKEEAASTYATKTELTNGLATKSDTGHKHVKADITDLAVVSQTEAGLVPALPKSALYTLRGSGQWSTPIVYQTASTAENAELNVLLKHSVGDSAEIHDVNFVSGVTINTTTKTITAAGFIGDLTGTAAKATADSSGNDIPTTYATKAEVASDLSNKSDVGHGHAITNVSGLQAALDAKQPTGDYATNTALTEGLAGKSDVGHTHTSENITDWDDATVSFWSTERGVTGELPASGSMGWTTIWSGVVNGDAVTTGFMVNVDSGDPMLTIQAKRGQQYGQIVLTKSDIRLQTGSGRELSVSSLMTTIGALGQTYAPLSHTHTTAQVTGLDTALAGKAAVSHTHTIADLPKASQAEAEAGSDDTKVMTPAVTKAAILELAPAPDLTPYATTEALNVLQSAVTALQTTVETINASYMPKSGGTFTGAVTVQGTVSGTGFQVVASNV